MDDYAARVIIACHYTPSPLFMASHLHSWAHPSTAPLKLNANLRFVYWPPCQYLRLFYGTTNKLIPELMQIGQQRSCTECMQEFCPWKNLIHRGNSWWVVLAETKWFNLLITPPEMIHCWNTTPWGFIPVRLRKVLVIYFRLNGNY